MMNIFLFLFVLISSSFSNDFTFNQESGKAIPKHIGELKLFRGQVFKQNSNGLTPIELGSKIYKKDNIVTEEKSFAKILMVDDSVFNIGPKSNVKFEEFDYKDKTDRKMIFTLIAGKLRGLIKNKAKEGDLIIKTQIVTMGVRGTEFLVNHQNLKAMQISEFGLLEGSVQLTNKKNEQYDLKKPERMIFVEDNTTSEAIQEKNILSDLELLDLKKDEEFMAYFSPEKLDPSSALMPYFSKTQSSSNETTTGTTLSAPENGPREDWRSNLKKLNEKLRENHKKIHTKDAKGN